jgi:DNA-binding response OmpR family regulator
MTAGRVILSVSPFACDHQSVQAGAAACSCRVALANNLSEALLRLIELDIGVVVCERELLPGTWLDVLQRLHERPSPPLLIVTSRLADDRFWAEALNLGAWDVVVKPFIAVEIARSIEQAWSHRDFKYSRIVHARAGRPTV